MTSHRKLAALLAVTLAIVATPTSAPADAILGPPDDCPDGQTGISDHGGPRCVPVAPTDCPTGWRGYLGGNCSLVPCTSDASCKPDEACVEHAVCLQPSEDEYYDYGEEEREEHGLLEPPASDVLRSPGLLAGPPMPKKKRPKPIVRYSAVNLCARDVPCAAPGTCQPEKLCVPKGSRALAYRGTNIGPVRVARKTDTPLTQSTAEPTEIPAAPPSPKGCAGCATAPAPEGVWALGAAAGLLAALARRRGARRG